MGAPRRRLRPDARSVSSQMPSPATLGTVIATSFCSILGKFIRVLNLKFINVVDGSSSLEFSKWVLGTIFRVEDRPVENTGVDGLLLCTGNISTVEAVTSTSALASLICSVTSEYVSGSALHALPLWHTVFVTIKHDSALSQRRTAGSIAPTITPSFRMESGAPVPIRRPAKVPLSWVSSKLKGRLLPSEGLQPFADQTLLDDSG